MIKYNCKRKYICSLNLQHYLKIKEELIMEVFDWYGHLKDLKDKVKAEKRKAKRIMSHGVAVPAC